MEKLSTLLLLCLFAFQTYSQNLPASSGLSVDYLRSPDAAVITDATPAFAWIFPQSGMQQAAYRILVATSPSLLKEGKADLWDSGLIKDPASVNISYSGKPLKDNSSYWWQVKVSSESGLESSYSVAQQFNTGNFDRSDVNYPGESRWVELTSNHWVSEDKQCASFERFEAKKVMVDKGKYFADYGKSVIGILEFTATAEADHMPVSVHLGERKNDNQTVNKEPGRSNIGYQQIDMILKKGTHHYTVKLAERRKSNYLHTQKLAPHYPDVIPFRYVEIQGAPELYKIDEAKQAALFYYFDDQASGFECADENLKAVWDLCKYTQKSTPFLGVYADGNRERMPYEADAYIQMMSHFATDREYSIARYTINFLLDHASWPTEWQMHTVFMAWEYYMQTGDDTLLKDRYEDLKRKSLIALTDDNGLISTRTGKKTQEFLTSMNFPGKAEQFRDIVDWPQGAKKSTKRPAGHMSPLEGGETDGYVYTDYNTVVNAFHNRCLVLMADISEVVGNNEDQAFFVKRAKEHKAIFLSTFFDEKKGFFKDGESTDHSSLHANMFPMAFNMVPEKNIPKVAEFIKSRGMACSVYGSQYLLEALYNAGEADHALGLMTSDSKRSWLNMIRVGSSMTTEAWDEFFKPNLTWNHAWGSAPANITARKLMGIEPIEPSFSKIRISPQPGKLANASITVPSIRGAIKCDLNNTENEWQMKISVPGNSQAELWLPAKFKTVQINGANVKSVRIEQFCGGTRKVYQVDSGIFSVVAMK